jgi:hypothetical protein
MSRLTPPDRNHTGDVGCALHRTQTCLIHVSATLATVEDNDVEMAKFEGGIAS